MPQPQVLELGMSWAPERRLLTVAEAAASIGRPRSTIRRWLAEGRLVASARRAGAPLILESHLLELEAQLARSRPRIRHAAG